MFWATLCNPPDKADLLARQLKAEGIDAWTYLGKFVMARADEDPFPLTFSPEGKEQGKPVFSLYNPTYKAETKVGLTVLIDVEFIKLERQGHDAQKQ